MASCLFCRRLRLQVFLWWLLIIKYRKSTYTRATWDLVEQIGYKLKAERWTDDDDVEICRLLARAQIPPFGIVAV
jgi:hypothetical protein